MSSLIVLERLLWFTMTEMKEADKVPFLDAPVSSGSLFGPAVEGFAERFTEAQKLSQAMRHFLPKHTSSSAGSSCPRPVLTPQTAKPTPATPEPNLQRVDGIEGAHDQHVATKIGPAFRSMLSLKLLCYCRYSGESENNSTSLF